MTAQSVEQARTEVLEALARLDSPDGTLQAQLAVLKQSENIRLVFAVERERIKQLEKVLAAACVILKSTILTGVLIETPSGAKALERFHRSGI